MSPSCGITIDGVVKRCPRCGALMRTTRSIRTFGWVMLVCGVAFLLLMAWMGLTVLGNSSFTGAADEAQWAVVGFLVLFGLLASGNALYMVVTGRTSPALVKAMLVAVPILVIGAGLIRRLLG
jgi:hypothetical protein